MTEGRSQPPRRAARRAIRQAAQRVQELTSPPPVRTASGMPRPAAAFDLPADAILALPTDGEVLYRLVRHELPEARDFASNLAKHKRPFPDEHHIYYAGMSMFELKSQALSRAQREPKHVATVVLEPGHGFHIAKTHSAGHYTVWGDSEQLLEVARVEDDDA